MTGDSYKDVGKTEKDYDCAALVVRHTPNATAATWCPGETLSRNCYALFGDTTIGNSSSYRLCHSCIFKGMLKIIVNNYTMYYVKLEYNFDFIYNI